MNKSDKTNKNDIDNPKNYNNVHQEKTHTLKEEVKHTVKIEGELVLESLYEHSMKEAEHLKILSMLYMAAFILFAIMMIAFAATLYTYPIHHFVWNDGSTIWGAVIFKLLVFIPLAFLLWFFGTEARKARICYDIAMARSFVLKFAQEMLSSDDKKQFLKDFLKDFVIKSIGNHKIIT